MKFFYSLQFFRKFRAEFIKYSNSTRIYIIFKVLLNFKNFTLNCPAINMIQYLRTRCLDKETVGRISVSSVTLLWHLLRVQPESQPHSLLNLWDCLPSLGSSVSG